MPCAGGGGIPCRMSSVHELQIEKGVLNQGLVDITSTSDLDFFNCLDGNPPIIKVFTNDLARQLFGWKSTDHRGVHERSRVSEELGKVKLVSAPCDEALVLMDLVLGQSSAKLEFARFCK